MKMKIYVASSWRNPHQPSVVEILRAQGHEVYDFRNPGPGIKGFSWSDIDPDWQAWTPEQYKEALKYPIAVEGFQNDFKGMIWADMCVMVLPCGRSANTEAGWLKGAGKKVYVLQLDNQEPELMYNLYDGIFTSMEDLATSLQLGNDKVFEVQVRNYTIWETAGSHKEAAEKVGERYPSATLGLVNDYETIHEVMGHCEVSGAPIFENDDYLTDGEGVMWLRIHNAKAIEGGVDYFLNDWLVEHFPSDVKGDEAHNKVLFAAYWAVMQVVNGGTIEGVVAPNEDPELGWNKVITSNIRAQFAIMDDDMKGKALTAVNELLDEL